MAVDGEHWQRAQERVESNKNVSKERHTLRMPASNRKPEPLTAAPVRRRCIICGDPSYSQSGVHPQCAAKKAGAIALAAQKALEVEKPKPVRPQWAQRKWGA
jgi:hypothetical protein